MPKKIPQSVQKHWASSEEKVEYGFGSCKRNDYLCTRWWAINGCRLSVGCSLNAIHSRMWNWVQSPIRNPVFPQFPRLPLYKEKLRILPKLRKKECQPCALKSDSITYCYEYRCNYTKAFWSYALPLTLGRGVPCGFLHASIAHSFASQSVWLKLAMCLCETPDAFHSNAGEVRTGVFKIRTVGNSSITTNVRTCRWIIWHHVRQHPVRVKYRKNGSATEKSTSKIWRFKKAHVPLHRKP